MKIVELRVFSKKKKKKLQLYNVFIYLYFLNIMNILQITCTKLLRFGTDK